MAEIHIAVVGHHSREAHAQRLADTLNAHLFMDRLTLGATWNHLRALNWATQLSGHLIVLEDDAEPVPGFMNLATEAITRHPEDLISFYLGTDTRRLQRDITLDADYYPFRTLLHAVAYSLPIATIPTLKVSTRRVADEAIGSAWMAAQRRPILHATTSLVQHADAPSVEQAGRPRPPRRAWRLYEGV